MQSPAEMSRLLRWSVAALVIQGIAGCAPPERPRGSEVRLAPPSAAPMPNEHLAPSATTVPPAPIGSEARQPAPMPPPPVVAGPVLACRTTGDAIVARSEHNNGSEGDYYDKRATFGAQGWQAIGDDDVELGLEGSGTAVLAATESRILRGLVRVSYDGNHPALTFRHALPFDPTAKIHVAKVTHPEAAGAIGGSGSDVERRGWLVPRTTFSVTGRRVQLARGAVIFADGFVVWADIDDRVRWYKTHDFTDEGLLWSTSPLAVAARRADQLWMAGNGDNATVVGRLTRWGPKDARSLVQSQGCQ